VVQARRQKKASESSRIKKITSSIYNLEKDGVEQSHDAFDPIRNRRPEDGEVGVGGGGALRDCSDSPEVSS